MEYPCNRSRPDPNGSGAPPRVVITPGSSFPPYRVSDPPLHSAAENTHHRRPYHMRLLHLYLFRNGIRAFPHLIGLRHSACPCCLHAATSFSTFEGSPYRWTCRGVFARLSIGVNLGWESRGGEVCGTRGLDGTGNSSGGNWNRFPPVHTGAKGCRRKSHVPDGLAKTIVRSPTARRRWVGAATLVSGTGQVPAYGGQPVLPVAQAETVGPAAGRGNRKLTLPGR